jgi:hypothetical protein
VADSRSAAFEGAIGVAVPVASVPSESYLIDPSRFPSEGNWAFCRFTSDEVRAARIGFQRGGFNGGNADVEPSPSYLQLHLELLTDEGAVLWLPSAVYDANSVRSNPERMDVSLDHEGREIFSLVGWPEIECHFRSDDGYAEVDLRFTIDTVTVLPDCILPHCLFAMWESMGAVAGSVRYGERTVSVSGKVFFDHTRIIPRRHAVALRHMYVYTTLYFDDGSGLFGYHSVDAQGQPVAGYCFGVYLDSSGRSCFVSDAKLTHLALDGDGIAKSWKLTWQAEQFCLSAEVAVQGSHILECWGSPNAPQTRWDFSIIPLVLDSHARVTHPAGGARVLRGYGLAEYFNADLWPADAATAAPAAASPAANSAPASP